MERLDKTFETFVAPETYHRVDGTHPLNLYIGLDEKSRWSLLLISDTEPPTLESSKMISAQKRRRPDSKWTLSLSLVDDAYKEMFLLFCGDIIDSSRVILDRKKAVKFIARRYKEWREMLASSRRDTLSPNEIKGLLGEMYYLQNYLAPLYGIEKAALSWTGPRKLPQDFIVDETWYEIKTILSSGTEISISSIEQLDCSNPGELAVIHADKTSVTNGQAVNLNQIYHQILMQIQDDMVKAEFSSMLLQYGYFPREEYESAEYTFEIKDVLRFAVTSAFPCLRRNGLPSSILKAEYSISLPSISAFRKE